MDPDLLDYLTKAARKARVTRSEYINTKLREVMDADKAKEAQHVGATA